MHARVTRKQEQTFEEYHTEDGAAGENEMWVGGTGWLGGMIA